MTYSLLPPNATTMERAIEATIAARIDAIEVPLASLWDPASCPLSALPWLAWAVGVDNWDAAWPEATKRAVVAGMISIRRHRGTIGALKRALTTSGYASADITEGYPSISRDGSVLRDGTSDRSGGSRWALFDVALDLGEEMSLTSGDISDIISNINRNKRASCHLKGITYRATLEDSMEMTESASTTVSASLSDVWPIGPRRDGSVQRNQGAFIVRDGTYRRDGSVTRKGWIATGIRRDSEREAFSASGSISHTDAMHVPLIRAGHLFRNGLVSRGSGVAPSMLEGVMPIQIIRTVYRDGSRLRGPTVFRAGNHLRDGSMTRFNGVYRRQKITEVYA